MAHVLATLHGLEKDMVEDMLHHHMKKDFTNGLHLEHIWINALDDDEVVFLFKADSIEKARNYLQKVHEDATRHHPEIEAPEVTYLKK